MIFINTTSPEENLQLSKPMNEIQEMDNDSSLQCRIIFGKRALSSSSRIVWVAILDSQSRGMLGRE